MPIKDPTLLGVLSVMPNGSSLTTEGGTSIIEVSSTGTPSIKANIQDSLASGYIYVGNASGVSAEVAVSGDATLSNAGVVSVTGLAAGVTAAGKINLYPIGSAAASASGLLAGVGTSADPASTSTADAIFVELRTQSTATSGDSRGIYLRHDINGAGGGGDALRAFAKVTAAASTVRGSHISIDLDAAGSVSGFGAAVDAQVLLGAAAYDDTLTAANLEIYASAGATVTGATSMLRPVIQGDATAVADVNANAFFLDLSEVVASATGFIDTDITALTGYGALRVKCPDGVTRYIPITTGA